MGDLRKLLRRAADEFEERRAAATARVDRWEYWSAPAYDPKPLYFERTAKRGVPRRGERLAGPRGRGCAYGLDARGRVVIDRQPKSGPDEPAFEEFFTHNASAIESAAYRRDARNSLLYVTRQRLRGGRPVSTEVLDADPPHAHFSERYHYRGGRLARVYVVTGEGGRDDKRVRFDATYEPDGRLRAVFRHYDHYHRPYPVYWNLAPGETPDSLAEALCRRLVDLIPRVVRGARVSEPAYCLALAYDESGDELPPVLGVGLDRERRRTLEARGKAARARVWDPRTFSRYDDGTLDLDDPDLRRECEKLLQVVLMTEALHVPQRLLNAAAADLNRRHWKGVLPITDDFVVYARDVEGADLRKNLKAAVPPEKLAWLKSRRLI